MRRWHVKDKEYNHPKVWGNECWFVNTEKYCAKLLFVQKFHKCSTHYHKLKHETFIVCKGSILMELNGDLFVMKEGDAVEVPPGVKHSFTGINDANILEVSTQHFEDDSYRDNESKKLTWQDRRHLKKMLKSLGGKNE